MDKITRLLTTAQTFIHQVEVPSGAADLLGFENPPIVWLQLTLYHSILSPCSPGMVVLSISASFGSFLFCLFDLTCLHLFSLSALLVLHSWYPFLFYMLSFFFLHYFLQVHLFPWKAFSSSLLSFFPQNLVSCKAIFAYYSQYLSISDFSSPHKSLHSATCGRLNYYCRGQKTNFSNASLSPAWKVTLLVCLFRGLALWGFFVFLIIARPARFFFFSKLCDTREENTSLCHKLTHCPMLHFYRICSDMQLAQIMT